MVGWPPSLGHGDVPVFDAGESPSRAAKRLVEVLSKRGAAVEFIVPVDHLGEREIVQVPRALLDAFPGRVEVGLFDVKQPNEGESRRLHGKLIVLESDAWVAALVGSSNFSAPGLGLGGGGNVEVGLAIGAPAGSAAGNDLVKLALRGEEIAIERSRFSAETDPEERVLPIPAGFLQALGDPGPPAVIEFELDAELLPEEWWVRTSRRARAVRLRQLDGGGKQAAGQSAALRPASCRSTSRCSGEGSTASSSPRRTFR